MSNTREHDRIEAEIDRRDLSSDPFAAAMRATLTPMLITDPHRHDNPIIFVNDAFCRQTGYTRSEVFNRNCRFLQGSGTSAESISAIREAISERASIEIELSNYRKDGSEFWNSVLISPVFDDAGKLVYFVASQSDTSVQRAAKRRANEAEQQLDALIRSSSEVRFSINADWSELLELAGGDFIPDTTSANGDWLNEYIPLESRNAVREEIERAIRTKSTYLIEHQVNRVDGTIGWALSRAVPLLGPEGGITGWIGAASDITDRKRAESALRASEARLREVNETLEHRVAKGIAERANVEDQLRQAQKLEAVGQLTGGVAHDFNNLLTVIKSATDLLKRPDLSEDRRARYVGAISDTVDRAAKLTGQLLAFARRQTLKPEVFDATKSVREMSDMMGTLTGSRIVIDLKLCEIPCYISADPSQFDTALVNMGVNARDAMGGHGKITIGVESVEYIPAVRLHTARPGKFVAVSITDTGSGIAADDLDRIFEPFFTTKGVGEGTGLGLSQVFGFAKQSGGEVTVESVVGEGTTFTLYLPHVDELVHPADASEPEVLIDGHGTCVLVVEDNVDVGTFATQTLAELGYITVWAASAEEALAELSNDAGRFDVVFSDVVMGGMNGIELAQQIRLQYQDLPVVLTSGYSHVLAENGTSGFQLLHKPYSVEQLSRILRKAAKRQRRTSNLIR